MVTILVADDHTLIRSALKIIIKNNYPDSTVDEAADGDSAFLKIREHQYALVIMDVNMPGTDSFALVTNILSFKPETKILIFSMNPEQIYARRYLAMGTMGYLNKDAGEEETVRAIRTVLGGKRYISRSLAESLAEEAFGNSTGSPFDKLSPREFEVVQHLIQGKSVSQICQELKLNASTVSSHKSRILEKLGVSNPIEITQLAKAYNIL